MRLWFLYTPWCLILTLYCLKFLNQPTIVQSLIWRPNHTQRDESHRPKRIKPVLNYPLPMTLRQLGGFGVITGYCSIWIPGYRKLVQPLYKLITETQQAQTDKVIWSPDTQTTFKALQAHLLHFLLWACPRDQSLICLSLKEKVWPRELWPNLEDLTSNL